MSLTEPERPHRTQCHSPSARLGAILLAAVLAAAVVGCNDTNPVASSVASPAVNFACAHCHADIQAEWASSPHANTQADLADELAAEDTGMTPAEVVNSEDCVTCHAPTAVNASTSPTEPAVLAYFFTTTGGVFTDSTTTLHTDEWPHVACAACHQLPAGETAGAAVLASFDSRTKTYESVSGASELCGQCHGSLRFSDTDHRTYDAWTSSKHGMTQQDVADELSSDDVGLTPVQVTTDEDCIACHAPTAVLANGGMSEDAALGYFFTTSGSRFFNGTSVDHTEQWPDVSCTACHDPHAPGEVSYFNSETKLYERMAGGEELCGQCHGSLRFPDTDHLSYDILQGTGGIGIPPEQTMPGVTCVNCHMFVSDTDGSASAMAHGHSFAITVKEPGGGETVSCLHCHSGFIAATYKTIIDTSRSNFASLDQTARANVEAATAAMAGVTDSASLAMLAEAQHNLEYAESDESGGFHNHRYLMHLLEDANAKALTLLGR